MKKKLISTLTTILLGSSAMITSHANTNNTSPQFALPQFSNVIVFGDSLSDSGNFPEASTIIDPNTSTPSRISTNLYVPVSNPVIPNLLNLYLLPNSLSVLHYPNQSLLAKLPPQAPLMMVDEFSQKQSIDIPVPRHYKSYGWFEYFLQNAKDANLQEKSYQNNLLVSSDVNDLSPKSASVDYAFYSALSNNNCQNPNYGPAAHKDCTESQVLTARQQYIHNNTFANYDKVLVPAAGKQIQFFEQDQKNNNINTNSQTLYLLWSGANDASDAFEKYGFKSGLFNALENTIPEDQVKNVKTLVTNGAKNIVVFNQFNLAYTPEFIAKLGLDKLSSSTRYLVASILNFLPQMYNKALVKHLATYQSTIGKNATIYIYNVNQVIQNNVFWNKSFQETIGKRCEDFSLNYASPISQADSNNCSNYLFWNNAHPAAPMQQIIAYNLMYDKNAVKPVSKLGTLTEDSTLNMPTLSKAQIAQVKEKAPKVYELLEVVKNFNKK